MGRITGKCPECGCSLSVSEKLEQARLNEYRIVKTRVCSGCGWQDAQVAGHCKQEEF